MSFSCFILFLLPPMKCKIINPITLFLSILALVTIFVALSSFNSSFLAVFCLYLLCWLLALIYLRLIFANVVQALSCLDYGFSSAAFHTNFLGYIIKIIGNFHRIDNVCKWSIWLYSSEVFSIYQLFCKDKVLCAFCLSLTNHPLYIEKLITSSFSCTMLSVLLQCLNINGLIFFFFLQGRVEHCCCRYAKTCSKYCEFK